MIVSVQLMGGLGNQLFQLFTTIAYAMRTSRKFVFPYSTMLGSRYTYWDSFLHRLKGFTTLNHPHITNDTLFQFPRFREPGFQYTDIPSFQEENILLYGYFQSHLYFQEELPTILSLIQFKKQQEDMKLELMNHHSLQEVIGEDSISMHFRLGDYKNLQEHHPLMTYEYYEQAVQKIVDIRRTSEGANNHSPDLFVYYFCQEEDNAIVLEMISKLSTKFSLLHFIKVEDTFEDWKQMLIMSCCRDNIIANSTFSWWGAFLNTNVEKIVCYPSKWFGPLQNKETGDLFPSNWNRILV
jgi:hypothetical protein